MTLTEFDHRLQYGRGLRVQRLVEAGFLIAALLGADLRFSWVTLGSTLLQALSPRLAPVAAVIACAMSAVVQALALGLVHLGHTSAGLLLLALPAASFVLSPTVGFCAGCSVYVGLRELGVALGVRGRGVHGACDVELGAPTDAR
jgi:hypothetical protein